MVDVEVEDGDALDRAARQGMDSRDGDAVEDAESHGRRGFGVMAGRADGAEHTPLACAPLIVEGQVDPGDRCTGGRAHRSQRAGAHERVGIKAHQAFGRRKAFDGIHVVRVVHAGDLLASCLGGRDGFEIREQSGLVQVFQNGLQTGGTLGVPRPHLVVKARRVGNECGHARTSAKACWIAGFRA